MNEIDKPGMHCPPKQGSRPLLKLVSSPAPAHEEPWDRAGGELISQLTLAGLWGRQPGSTESMRLRPTAWQLLIESLGSSETLLLTHLFDQAQGCKPRYRFSVQLIRRGIGATGLGAQGLHQALHSTLPDWSFENSSFPRVDWPIRAVVQPAPLRLTRKGSGSPDPELLFLPYPADLPNWSFTRGFDEPIATDQSWALQIRLERLIVDADGRNRMHRLLQELRRGVLRVHGAGSLLFPYIHDEDLDARTQLLLRSWLAASMEVGYSISAALRSEEEISSFAISRVAQDVFGHVMPLATYVQYQDASRESMPLLVQQGIGGIFASNFHLRDGRIPTVQAEPVNLPPGPGVEIARSHAGSPVLLPDSQLCAHALVVGSTGSGKSSLLCRIASETMRRGRGLTVLCPHGKNGLFGQVLRSVPPERQRDVVVVDVSDTQGFSVALNPFNGTQHDAAMRRLVSGQFVDLVDRNLEGIDTTGPQTRSRLRNLAQLAMCHPQGGTPADIVKILADCDYREYLASKADRRTAAAVEQYFRGTGQQDMANWIPWIAARIEPFASNPALVRLFNRPSTVDLLELMQRKAIIAINLGKSTSLSEAEVQLAGSVIMSMFNIAAMRGNAAGQSLEEPHLLIVDEAHSYTAALTQTVREARKFGLSLILATQAIEALRHPVSGELATSILANTATKIFLRLGPREAALLEEYTAPTFTAKDLVRLPNFEGVLSMPACVQEPFAFKAALPMAMATAVDLAVLYNISGAQFGTPVAIANEYLASRHGIEPEELGSLPVGGQAATGQLT